MTWYLGDLIPYLPLILQGLWVSIYVSVASFLAGSALGWLPTVPKRVGHQH